MRLAASAVRAAAVLACSGVPTSAMALTPEIVRSEAIQGVLHRFADFRSAHVAPRNVDVWLPPDYEAGGGGERHAVLYMQDGQMLWDPETTWNKQSWEIDETMSRLIGAQRIRPAIVVGIWNTAKRLAEYMPRKALTESAGNEELLADAYLTFLVKELKPFIDARYGTLSGRADTFVMGSSMGGLISIYAVAEYPEVFGGAACLSTHWPAGEGIVVEYLRKHLPRAGVHRIYFDFGTETLDSEYEPHQRRMDVVMRARGYTDGADWVTRKFTGADHSERSWAQRVDLPLTFLLGRR